MALTGKQKQDFSSYCTYEGISFVTGEELQAVLDILKIESPVQNLIRNNMVESVYKGKVYRVSGETSTIEKLLSRMFTKNEPFYLTGIYTYNAYDFIEQLPSRYQVANRKIQKDKTIAGYNIIFKKVNQSFFYGIDKKTYMSVKERALIDFCYSFGYDRFIEVLTVQKSNIDVSSLIDLAVRYPVNKIARRVLYGIDSLYSIDNIILDQLDMKSLTTLTEKKSREGKIDKRFNIIINQ